MKKILGTSVISRGSIQNLILEDKYFVKGEYLIKGFV